MDWSDLPVCHGLPIDGEQTRDYHQFISADSDNLYFNVFYAPLKEAENAQYRAANVFCMDEYVNRMCAKTPEKIQGFRELERLQSNFMRTIRPHGKHGFEKGQLAKTLQFVLPHDADYNNTGFAVRPVLGLITGRKTLQQAEDDVFANEPDFILSQCLNYYVANYVTTDRAWGQKISYSRILDDISGDICKNVALLAFEENLDCVCRIDPDRDLLLGGLGNMQRCYAANTIDMIDRNRRYRSITKQNSRPTKNDTLLDKAVVPITASRKSTDYWNIRTIAKNSGVDGSNEMPDGVSTAFANYSRHVANGQRLGFLCA